MDWKQRLLNRAVVLLQDPRVGKLLQDPRVMNGIVGAMKLRSDMQRSLTGHAKKVAKSLRLAAEDGVQERQRAVARLEIELERARGSRRDAPDGRSFS